MDWLTKQKTYLWLIIILIVINIFSLTFIWLRKPCPPAPNPGDFREKNLFLKKELGLNDEQMKNMELLRKELRDTTDLFMNNLWQKRRELQKEALKDKPDTNKVNYLISEISGLNVKTEQYMLKHFSELKKILSPDQFEKFIRMMDKPKMQGKPMMENGDKQVPPPPPDGVPPKER